MGIRARLWRGLRIRDIWLDAALALVAGAAVLVDAVTDDPDPVVSPGVLLLGAAGLAVLTVLFRRSFPIVPFAVSTALAAVSVPALVAEMLTAYAVGRYVGRWSVRIAAAAAGALAVLRPWLLGSFSEWVGELGTFGVIVVLPGALGIWQRTRAVLLATLRERAERAEAERELLARDA